MADYLTRLDFVILDELGYLPFAQSGGQLLFHLISRSTNAPRSSSPPTSPSANGRPSSATPR
jgi:DNA replication protein DnaC